MTATPEINPHGYMIEYWKHDTLFRQIRSAPDRLREINREAGIFRASHGHRPRVLFGTRNDMFNPEIPLQWRHDLMMDIAEADRIDAIILTTRINAVKPDIHETWARQWPAHVGLVLTVTGQDDHDIFRLLMLKLEFGIPWVGLNIAPMTGYVSLQPGIFDARQLDWVMACGGLAPGGDRLWPHCIQVLRQHCVKYNIPFFFVGWGDRNENGEQVGYRESGRVLDGRTWEQFPEYFERD